MSEQFELLDGVILPRIAPRGRDPERKDNDLATAYTILSALAAGHFKADLHAAVRHYARDVWLSDPHKDMRAEDRVRLRLRTLVRSLQSNLG